MQKVSEKEHLNRVAELGCVLCWILYNEYTPCQVHHLKKGCGIGQRASHFITCGLCPEHHTGQTGFHGLGRRAFEARYGLTELDLLAWVIEKL